MLAWKICLHCTHDDHDDVYMHGYSYNACYNNICETIDLLTVPNLG